MPGCRRRRRGSIRSRRHRGPLPPPSCPTSPAAGGSGRIPTSFGGAAGHLAAAGGGTRAGGGSLAAALGLSRRVVGAYETPSPPAAAPASVAEETLASIGAGGGYALHSILSHIVSDGPPPPPPLGNPADAAAPASVPVESPPHLAASPLASASGRGRGVIPGDAVSPAAALVSSAASAAEAPSAGAPPGKRWWFAAGLTPAGQRAESQQSMVCKETEGGDSPQAGDVTGRISRRVGPAGCKRGESSPGVMGRGAPAC